MAGWVLRTFRSRGKGVMLTLLRSLVQPRLDYCSQLWSPRDQHSINRLELVQHQFISQIRDFNLIGLNYWEKLSYLRVYSQEMAIPNNINRTAPAIVKKDRERSLGVHGARLFNLLPQNLRNENSGDFLLFKNHLDIFLSEIPDQPTTHGLVSAAATNSLLDQVPLIVTQDF